MFLYLASASKPFLGSRYLKDGDNAVMLLYDRHGYIAGIQVGVSIHVISKSTSQLVRYVKWKWHRPTTASSAVSEQIRYFGKCMGISNNLITLFALHFVRTKICHL